MRAASARLIALLNGQRKAISFDGLNDHVLVLDAAPLKYTGQDFSVGLWINADAADIDSGHLISKPWNDSGQYNYEFIYNANSTLSLFLLGATSFWLTTAATVPFGSFHHIAFTIKSATKLVTIYIDGVAVTSGTHAITNWVPTIADGNVALAIGTLFPYGSPWVGVTSQAFKGIIDDVRIYGRALSASEVAAQYRGVFQDNSGLVGWWPFDEGSGTTAFDLSGYGNNGTLANGPTYVDFNPYPGTEKQFLIADLLTITQANGTITRFTNADFDIVANTFTFLSSGPRFTRGKTKLVLGIVVDSMPLSIFADATQLLAGVPWPQAAAAGALDGARILVERAHMATWGDTSVGTVILFSGRVSEINPSRYEVALVVRSDLELLDIQMPRNTLQPNCIHTLYDAGCTLLKSAFLISGVVTAGSTAAAILASALTQATGYFDLGTMTFTSGALSGVTRNVKTYTNIAAVKTINPVVAFPAVPANGDTFSIYPGCDKTQATCTTKFTNLTHFRGYPYVPVPETQAK